MVASLTRQVSFALLLCIATVSLYFKYSSCGVQSIRGGGPSRPLVPSDDGGDGGAMRYGGDEGSDQEADEFEQLESTPFADLKTEWVTRMLKDIAQKSKANTLSVLELVFLESGSLKSNLSQAAPNARVSSLTISVLEQVVDSEAYDVIVCIDVFARVANPVHAFGRVAKLLRNRGGVLLATSPFSGNFRPKSGPPILAKLGNLWFKRMASDQNLILSGVWSEGTYEAYMKELCQRVFGCEAIPTSCRGGWYRGFMVRLEKGSGVQNEVVVPASPQALPPCKKSNWMHHSALSFWMRRFENRGNPGTRDFWIKEKIKLLCNVAQGGDKPKVLDVSAGNRPYKADFENAGCRYFSNEFGGNQQIIDDLRGEVRKNLAMHDYLGPDITNTTAPSSHFDIVILTEVLEHVPDALAAVRELRRVAKTGASILLTSPLTSGPHQLPFHFASGYSEYWYIAIAEFLELDVISVEPQGDVFALIQQECGGFQPRTEKNLLKTFYGASLSPEHAIGWMAHLRKPSIKRP